MSLLRGRGLLLLLVFVPVAIGLELFAPEQHTAIFVASVLAILPLAAYMGRATETLAEHLGGGIGGLLNATFGNAAELIIGALALRAGLTDLVKASLTGSIIGNVLLVFGAAALYGGLRHPVQRFNRTAAGLGTTMLLLSTIGLVIPAVFHRLSRGTPNAPELELDTEIRRRALRHLLREPGVHTQDTPWAVRSAGRGGGVRRARRREAGSRGTGSQRCRTRC